MGLRCLDVHDNVQTLSISPITSTCRETTTMNSINADVPAAVAIDHARVPNPSRRDRLVALISWPIAAWTSYVFLSSLPYKFTNHPDTQHIFSTIGDCIGSVLGGGAGSLFSRFGAYAVGSLELVTSLLLLTPIALWLIGKVAGRRVGPKRAALHAIGGLVASAHMLGAVFFHLATPLGIVVLHQGQSDGGSLFTAAVPIAVIGIVLFAINRSRART